MAQPSVVGNEEIPSDLSDIFDVTSSTESLEKKLDEVRVEEHEIFEFNTGAGIWINRLMPMPVIAAGIIYQLSPDILTIDITSAKLPVMLLLILFGQLLWQTLLAKRARGLKLTRASFELQGVLARRNGHPFKSREGYDEVSNTLKDEHMQAISHRVFGVLAILCYLVTLIGALLFAPPAAWSEMLEFSLADPLPFIFAMSVAMGTGLSILVWLAAIMDPTTDFDASEPTGLLSTYVPSGHPSLLTSPFSQILLYMMEPCLANRWLEHNREIGTLSIEGTSEAEARERTLFLLHMMQEGVLDREQVRNELDEIYPESVLDGILDHEVFDVAMIHRLFEMTRAHNPSFFRTIDRLEHAFMNRLQELKEKPFIFDCEVDRQVSTDQVNLIIYLANTGAAKATYELEVTSPGLNPESQIVRVEFSKEQSINLPEEDYLEISKGGDNDLIHIMGEALDCGSMIWLSMQPTRKGLFKTQVLLKDENGNILEGRSMRTKVSKDISQALKQYSGRAGKAGGLAVPLLKAAPSLRRMFGLP